MRPPSDVQADGAGAAEVAEGAVRHVADEVRFPQVDGKPFAADVEPHVRQRFRWDGDHLLHPFLAEFAAVTEEGDVAGLLHLPRLEQLGVDRIV